MGTSDGSMLLAATRWGDDAFQLRDFIDKYPLPQVAKIIKGSYMNLGVPTLPNPSLSPTVFLCSAGKRLKISAQCVKFKESSKKVVPVGPKIAIPESYEGWFEILSEEGRAMRYIESVSELARRFPDSCLVRENIKAYISKGDSSQAITDKVRTVQIGEILILVGEVIGTSAQILADRLKIEKSKNPGRFLRCFDSSGSSVYLSFDQKGKFSPIAKEDNISGVHNIKNLFNKRFPIMVRLVYGKPPVGGKICSGFLPELRLFDCFEEEGIMGLALQKDSNIVAIPPTAVLKVLAPRNPDSLQKMLEFGRVHEKCKKLMEDVSNRIQVFDVVQNKESKNEARVIKRGMPMIRRSVSDPYGGVRITTIKEVNSTVLNSPGDSNERCYEEIDQIYDYVRGFAPLPNTIKHEFTEDSNDVLATSSSPSSPGPLAEKKPVPPPVETIPTRRASEPLPPPQHLLLHPIPSNNNSNPSSPAVLVHEPSKRYSVGNIYDKVPRKFWDDVRGGGDVSGYADNGKPVFVHVRPGNNKLYIKSSSSPAKNPTSKTRLFRQHSKTSTPPFIKDPLLPKTVRASKPSSPSLLFNIRYKSLTNLTIDFNTLDSSTSGGRTSAGSGGSSYLPTTFIDKKPINAKLTRPKSLSNLMWPDNANHAKLDKNKVNLISSALTKADHKKSDIKESNGHQFVQNNGKSPNELPAKRLGTIYL